MRTIPTWIIAGLIPFHAWANSIEPSDPSLPGAPTAASQENAQNSDASSKTPARRNHSRLLEEVIVTAQKREESLADVPIAISSFSEEVLDAKGVLNAQDLPSIVPGLTLSTSVNFLTIFMRGIGSDAFLVADPSVASYVDGVYFPFSNGAVQDFGALERIEVLKGPQGTLFGRNAVGGAINVITRKPNLENIELELQGSYVDYNAYTSRAHVNLPLLDSLAVSISGIYNDGDNYIDGQAGGKKLQRDRTDGGRIKLFWSPTPWMELTLTTLFIDQQGAGSDYAPNAQPSAIGAALGMQEQDPYAGQVNEAIFFEHKNRSNYGQLDLFLEPFDVRLIASHQDLESLSNYDFDGSNLPLLFFQIEPGAADVKTLELQFLSNENSPGSEWMEWITGLYYFESEAGFPSAFARAAGIDLVDGTIASQPIPGFDLINSVLSLLDAEAFLPSGRVDLVGVLYTESISAFAQTSVHVNDWLSVTVGGRYQSEERYIVESSAGLRTLDGGVLTNTQSYSAKTDPQWYDKDESFKPKIALEFRPDLPSLGPEPLIYVSWQQAIKGSSYNVVNVTDGPDYVRPEELQAFEVGLKASLFDQTVSINAAAFYYDLEDPQVQFLSALKGGVVSFENAEGAEVTGVEFDSIAQIFPGIIGGLVLTSSATFLDAKYTSYKNGTGYNEETGILQNNLDFSGNQIVRSPEFSGTLGLIQTIDTQGGSLELALDYYYTSEIFFLAQNSDVSRQDAYGTLGARLSYLIDDWDLRLTAFGKNITNEEYSHSIVVTDFGRNEHRAPKAFYGVRFNWSL